MFGVGGLVASSGATWCTWRWHGLVGWC